jgi:glucose/arabinose dehydrogenase
VASLLRRLLATAGITATTLAVTTGPLAHAAPHPSAIGVVEQIATDTDVPWGIGFLSDGSALMTERDAHKLVQVTTSGAKATVGIVPGVSGTDGEGGLLGLEISPDFDSDHWIYLYFTTASDNRVVRFKYENGALDTNSAEVLVSGIARNKFHNGGRLRFGPDGKLYASTGDALNGASAQDKKSLNGKILRIDPDGSIPSDNPFGNAVWSYGHRNVQGLAFDSQDRLWSSELGNDVMDELNLIEEGGNYGWPACEGTTGGCGAPGFIPPKMTWPVSTASPSGLAIVDDTVYMAALRGERLYQMTINGSAVSTPQTHFQGTYGRLRTVEPSPDGGLWLTTSNGDKDNIGDNSNTKVLHVALT